MAGVEGKQGVIPNVQPRVPSLRAPRLPGAHRVGEYDDAGIFPKSAGAVIVF